MNDGIDNWNIGKLKEMNCLVIIHSECPDNYVESFVKEARCFNCGELVPKEVLDAGLLAGIEILDYEQSWDEMEEERKTCEECVPNNPCQAARSQLR